MKKRFQVENYSIVDSNYFVITGRFVEGDVLTIGEIFNKIKYEGIILDVEYVLCKILMYKHSVSCIDLGMVGELVIKGTLAKENNIVELIVDKV